MRDDQRRLMDEAIDDMARALTEGQPRAALRTNIAARIAGHQYSPWRLGWVAGSAVAAVVIVAVLMWPARVEDSNPVPAADVVQGSPDMPVGRTLSGSPGEPDKARPTSASSTGPVPIAIESSMIEPLVTESLVVDPLQPDVLALEALPVPMPLTLERLRVEPLLIR